MSLAAMKCPHCGKVIKFPVEKLGLSGPCPQCKEKITLVNQVKQKPADSPGLPTATEAKQGEVIPREPVQQTTVTVPDRSTSPEDAQLSTPPADPAISRFAADGQDPNMIGKLVNRIREVCTDSEEPIYMAVQQKPAVNISPDAVVLTNRRAIVFRQKILGRMDFVDVLWMDVRDVHVKENFIGATLTIQGNNGHIEEVDYLPKVQARRVYRIGQEMEERMIEFRRDRKMEEDRNAASNVVVNTAVAPASPAQPVSNAKDDLVERLKKLKEMLDADLITEGEYAAKKTEIMNAL